MPRAATTKPYKPRAPKVEAKPEVPKMEEVRDHEWMNGWNTPKAASGT